MIKLSIIIPTRNRAVVLRNMLESITKQTLDQSMFEVIICDNNSTDNTYNVANSFATKFQHFKYIKTLEPGLHVGRNRGFQEARGDILVYGDDDIEAFPAWLEGVVESFRDSEVGLVGGKCLPKYEVDPPEWVEYLWARNQYGKTLVYFSLVDFGDEIKEIPPLFVFGCNFSIRRYVFDEVKGFHPDAMPQELIRYRGGGESYISLKIQELGYKTIYNPKASVYHWVLAERMTLEYLKQRSFNQGISNSFAEIRNNHFGSGNHFSKHSSQSIYHKIQDKSFVEILGTVNRRVTHFGKSIFGNIHENHLMRKEMEKAENDGYEYHQNEVQKDPELLKWVLKDNYL